jgi:c-di-GMP-binding flagellar brake protein YcgR
MMEGLNDRRRYARFSVLAPVEYNYEYNKPKEPTRTLDLSEGGALISTRGFIGRGSNLTLGLFLKSGYTTLRSRVAHIERQARGDGYRAGLQFIEPSKDYINNFRREIDDLELFKIRCSREAGRPIPLSEASSRYYERAPSLL